MLFLNSIWLFAIAALSIPVAIHLWNIKPSKTLKIGSISLFDKAAQKSSRSFRLNDIPLFLLRCLLLLLLALMLAGPIWQRYNTATKSKGWLLIPKENLKEGYGKFKPLVDSLIKIGYEFHFFNKGFAKADLNKVIADSIHQKNNAQSNHINYWNTVAALNQQLEPEVPVYIITPNDTRYFTGEKPTTGLNLQWRTYTPKDSVSKWIEDAWFTPDNDIKVITGISKPSATNFTYTIVKADDRGNSPFEINTQDGNATVKLNNTSQTAVIIDTATLQLTIYADKNTVDARYLTATLQAIATFRQLRINIKNYNDPALIPAGQSWIFWLSDKPIEASISKKTSHIFKYEAGTIDNTVSCIKTNSPYAVGEQGKQIASYKLVNAGPKDEALIWHDGFGRPILSQNETGKTEIFHFYSRFNPTWSDLVWSEDFPRLLFKLIIDKKENEQSNQYDRRMLDQEQLLPFHEAAANNNKPTEQIKQQTDLSHYLWGALIAVFMMERWWSQKNKAILKND
ncbi:BatA domain-containing protein [Mucilaginibacter aquaedulcis]|uniref:BatA domain-containing protein n=1 Tax=Mucilaginibacter aquaedulcis TaxID=1187081 RepID=UPI0025B37A5C|nr:BatA domain-containing protein [Mucilaginibacter aquaedulcis]MDN3547676.1 BatA domain-containing protein [Mucilaginibacter aquaedulcis]